MAKRFYRPELDVLRFVAFFLVFAFHIPVNPLNHPAAIVVLRSMRCGLCLFFLLSAYLITELLVRERETTGTVHIKSFFVRRALRIWPLYFLAVGASYFLGHFSHTWHTPVRALPYLLLLATNIYIAHFGWRFALIAPLWSLSIEEQFYLIIPSIAKAGGGKMLRTAAIVCVVIAYVTLAWLGQKHKNLMNVVWVNSLMQFQFFAAGTLLALALHRREWRLSWAQRGLLLAGGSGLVVLSETWFHLFRYAAASLPGVVIGYAMVLVGCVAFFLAFVGAPLRAPAWMVYLGRISYGLYVVHGFTIGVEAAVLARLWNGRYVFIPFAHLLTLVPTILIAMLSFRYLEQPILKFKERFAYVKSGEGVRVA